MTRDPSVPSGLQAQIDALTERISDNRAHIDALAERADEADVRAGEIESRAAVDRDMISELHSDGVLSREHAAEMEEALRSSRTIGAAIGIVMASRGLDEDAAFAVLRRSSQNSNRKLREIAAEMVATTVLDNRPRD